MIDLLALADRLEGWQSFIAVHGMDPSELRDAASVLRRVQTVLDWTASETLHRPKFDARADAMHQAKAHVRSLLQPPTGVE